MTVDHRNISVNSYWALNPTQKIKLGSNEEYAEAFRNLFKEAVRFRLRSAFPVGSMLSGGLDSSSIVCMARQLLSQDGRNHLHTFSAIFDDVSECDEQPYINTVVAQGGLQPHFLHADKISPLAYLDDMFWYQEEAFLGTNMFMYWGLYNLAREYGIRILLDGDDGDTTVSHGLALLPELIFRRRWKLLATELKELSKHLNLSYWKILWSRAIKPLAPEGVRKVWRMLRRGNRSSWALNSIINPNLANRIGLEDRIQNLQRDWFKPIRTEQEDHFRGLSSGLIPSTLEMVDRAAMAFSIEPRYPFFDKRLAEVCLALPPEQKLCNGWTRMVMRRAMTNILPKEIQWRGTKSNLSPNFVQGLLAFERDRLENIIFHGSKIIEPYVDIPVLRETFQRYVTQERKDGAFDVWKAVVLARWIHSTSLASPTQEGINFS
jgi:asparagine synthase (glutamine-hydrolysing)